MKFVCGFLFMLKLRNHAFFVFNIILVKKFLILAPAQKREEPIVLLKYDKNELSREVRVIFDY